MTKDNTVGYVADVVVAMILIGLGAWAWTTHVNFANAVQILATNVGQLGRWWPLLLIFIGLVKMVGYWNGRKNR